MGLNTFFALVCANVTMLTGLFAIVILNHHKVKGSVLFGMLIAASVYWAGEAAFFKINPFESLKTASFVPPFKDMADTTLFKLDFAGFVNIGWLTVITLIITFCIIDLFDTIGTLVGTCSSIKEIPSSPATLAISWGSVTTATVPCGMTDFANSAGVIMELSI